MFYVFFCNNKRSWMLRIFFSLFLFWHIKLTTPTVSTLLFHPLNVLPKFSSPFMFTSLSSFADLSHKYFFYMLTTVDRKHQPQSSVYLPPVHQTIRSPPFFTFWNICCWIQLRYFVFASFHHPPSLSPHTLEFFFVPTLPNGEPTER